MISGIIYIKRAEISATKAELKAKDAVTVAEKIRGEPTVSNDEMLVSG